jgi:hypothetical protein
VRSAYAAYPDRPVKVVVANTPGGPSDLVGRMITAVLQKETGKTFVIENIGGAGGNIGMGQAARSEADGYTFLLATNAYSVNASLYNKIPYDPQRLRGVCELAMHNHSWSNPTTVVRFAAFAAPADSSTARADQPHPDLAGCCRLREKLLKLEVVVSGVMRCICSAAPCG